MAKTPRGPKPLMLYDATADAIKSIRLRKYDGGENKDFTQTECAKRAGERFSLRKWNEIETGKQRCLRDDLEGVLRGLMCTEAELREEKLYLERQNHLSLRADEIGEENPVFGTSWGAVEVKELHGLPLDELLPVHRGLFNVARNLVAADYSQAVSAADQIKILFENLKNQAAKARTEDREEPEDPDDTEEE